MDLQEQAKTDARVPGIRLLDGVVQQQEHVHEARYGGTHLLS